MHRPELAYLPAVLRPTDREALQQLGFKLDGPVMNTFILGALPMGWSQTRSQQERSTHVVYSDGRGRERIVIYPDATFTMEEAETDDAPLQLTLPAIRIYRRFRLQQHGDPHFRVFDRALQRNAFSHGHVLTWTCRRDAKDWLDSHYPRWDFDAVAYWDDNPSPDDPAIDCQPSPTRRS